MYKAHFGLTEKPFTLTPNPRFLFLSQTHQEALAHLFYGLENRVGFIAVTGEVGTGKTTILRSLLNQLDEERYRLALVFNPCLTPLDLLRGINREFGLVGADCSRFALIEELNRFLLEENRSGRTPVLVIDEAQNLTPEVLEQIRLLSNLEIDSDKLVQIVLVGQPELEKLLGRFDLRQLAQRITVRCRLKPLNYDEIHAYVRHRLEVAGFYGELFDSAALAVVSRWTQGLPRLINAVCDRALLCAYAGNEYRVSEASVHQAVSELEQIGSAQVWLGWRTAFHYVDKWRYWIMGAIIAAEVIVLIWLASVFV